MVVSPMKNDLLERMSHLWHFPIYEILVDEMKADLTPKLLNGILNYLNIKAGRDLAPCISDDDFDVFYPIIQFLMSRGCSYDSATSQATIESNSLNVMRKMAALGLRLSKETKEYLYAIKMNSESEVSEILECFGESSLEEFRSFVRSKQSSR